MGIMGENDLIGEDNSKGTGQRTQYVILIIVKNLLYLYFKSIHIVIFIIIHKSL